jgi:rhamnulokinase
MSAGREAVVAAVDLGASSGRVVAARCTASGVELREVHRFPNVPVRAGGVLRWDVLALFGGILDGLRQAAKEFGALDSVGVDSWGVDYGLLDGDGQLLGNPAHYRDGRTASTVATVLDTVGAAELYAATGCQFQPFNTVFQLLADRDSVQLGFAAQALLVPDLMSYWLSGSVGTEVTNASTTGLLDARTRTWSTELAKRLDVPVGLFPPLRGPGELLGPMRRDVVADAGLDVAPQVISVASHDTAAAVAGTPARSDRFAYVCTGTWALVGLELPEPVITEASRLANFTNEVGADGSIRFLRNVTGFWLLQECLRQWRADGLTMDVGALTDAATTVPPLRAVIDVQNPDFAAPNDMPGRVARAALETSGVTVSTPAEITRCILDSMALAVRHALRDAVRLAERTVDVVHIVGGAVANPLFCQLAADACQLVVLAGPAEAASWGNVLHQARALGVIEGQPADARALIERAEEPVAYRPHSDERMWERADAIVFQARSARR